MRLSIFDNQYQAVKELPEERRGAFWEAVLAYFFEGAEPQFSEGAERMAWGLVKPYLDKSRTAGQNGKKGGRKPKPKTKTENLKPKPSAETETLPAAETEPANLALSENENERERFENPLKDSQTLSPASGGGAGGDAARPGGKPCPPSVARAVAGLFGRASLEAGAR